MSIFQSIKSKIDIILIPLRSDLKETMRLNVILVDKTVSVSIFINRNLIPDNADLFKVDSRGNLEAMDD